MWDGFDQRKFPRLNLRCEIDILSDPQSSPIHTTTENIGIGGVCVILDKSLDRFSKCRIRLDLNKKNELDCDGKVVWIVPTRDSKSSKRRYDTGIEFAGLEPEQMNKLRQYIEKTLPKTAAK